MTKTALLPLRRKWGIYVCRCSVSGAFDPSDLKQLGAVVEVASGPEAVSDFAKQLRAAFAEQVLFACECTPVEALESACDEAGIAPEIHPLALGAVTRTVSDPGEAADKALRLVRGVVAGIDARPPVAQNLLQVPGRVAIFSDRAEGLELARRLPGSTQLVVFLEGNAATFGPAARAANWGRPDAVSGRLGAFQLTVAPVAGSDFRQSQGLTVDQVVVVGSRAEGLRARTGLHLLATPDAEQLQRISGQLSELTGTFSKPEHLRYDAAICAGGSADLQVCGRCIPACPYDAIHRDVDNPLRVRVDHLACEGCGACASACPTSALSFTEPAPEELYARLSAMLAPLGDDRGGPAPAVLFHCDQQGQGLLDWAGADSVHLPAQFLPVPVPCLRYVSEAAMLAAIRLGAAGVGLLGCESCPNGERDLLLQKLDFSQKVLDAFDLGRQRMRLLTVDPEQRPAAVEALQAFAASVSGLDPVVTRGGRLRSTRNREVVADSIEAFIAATGREIGGVRLGAEQPFARAEVNERGCTLCRACATVCPTHAFAFDTERQALQFKHINCIHCGLCESVCPEKVITLHHELYLERDALQYQTLAEDEMVHCARCDKPFISRRALDTIRTRLQGAQGVLDTFSGERARLLELCPDCRAIAAVGEVEKGWQP